MSSASNFSQIVGRYAVRDVLVGEAIRLLDGPPRGAAEINLEFLLRHHSVKAVVARRELDAREGIDRLLAFYSRMQLACMSGIIDELPPSFADSAASRLQNWHLRRFYQNHYPLVLPVALRLSLLGIFAWRTTDEIAGRSAFASFLDANSLLEDDGDAVFFLHLLDDFELRGIGFREVALAMRRPRRVGLALAGHRRETSIDRGIRGARAFLRFCSQFQKTLDGVNDVVLRSAYWHFHSYWFGRIGKKVGDRVTELMQNIKDWDSTDRADSSPVDRVMESLLDTRNGKAFVEAVEAAAAQSR